jgi:hypothetical protein
LNGTATTVLIPAGTLSPGTTYQGRLLFAKANLDTTSYPGALGIAGYFKETRLTVRTTGTVPAPVITNPTRLPSGQFQLSVIGEAGRTYRIDATSDFATWAQLINTNAPPGGNFSFTDGQASSMSRRFYRVVLP